MRSLFLALLLTLSSCVTYKTEDPISVQLSIFPSTPAVVEYTRKPIINKTDNNFIVSDEFVENSILLKKYADKIQEWKSDNKIK